ncbi:MAG: serine/threonine protein kinase [Phycisphaerales bacterium]|nr:serine/threonine protein kinase [Planctomycetota bacterium]MCH8508690.1 serine/threonine protein kinase [Phycisphaerales bacterium]
MSVSGSDPALTAWRRILTEADESGDHFAKRVAQRVGGFLEADEPHVRLPAPDDAVAWLDGVIPGVRLIREIGRGGMGVVYEAAEEQTARRIAVKLLHADRKTPALVRRLKREAEALARIDHPGIARLHSAGLCQGPQLGAPYLAMELVEGDDPVEHADKHRLGIRQRTELIAKIADAVGAAHREGVLHLDLKPSNIVIRGDGAVKLLDFGIAKILDETPGDHTLSFVTHPYGSIGSMAPEQADGRLGSPASDVYALGVLMYRLLTGKNPIDLRGVPVTEAARRLSDFEAPRARSVNRTLPRDLDDIAAVALARDPRDRYPNAQALCEDLERHLRSEPVRARPVGAIGQATRLMRRHPRISSGIGVALLLLSAVSAVATGFAIRANASAKQAAVSEARATARFGDITELAGSTIFQLHDAIEDLPGSTQARALLLSRAEEYLDRLLDDPNADEALQLTILEGLIRLSRLYGLGGGASKGELENARNRIEQARAIIRSLPAEIQRGRQFRQLWIELLIYETRVAQRTADRPDEPWSRLLADPIHEAANEFLRDFPDSLEARYYAAASLQLYARSEMEFGCLETGRDLFDQAIRSSDQASAAGHTHTGDDLVFESLRVRMNGSYWLMFHNMEEAGQLIQEALSITDSILAERPWSTAYTKIKGDLLSYQARFFADHGHHEQAVRAAEEAGRIAHGLFAIDPSNQQAHRSISIADYYVAYAYRAWLQDESRDPDSRAAQLHHALAAAHTAKQSTQDRIRRGWLFPWEQHYPRMIEEIKADILAARDQLLGTEAAAN